VRTRRFAIAAAVLAGGTSFLTVGCGSEGGADAAARGTPAPGSTVVVTRTARAAATEMMSRRPPKPTRSPTTKRSATATKPNSSPPPWCQLSDLRFSLSLGTGGGTGIAGSVLMANTSGRRCALTGYVGLTWRDAAGGTIPVGLIYRPDPQTPHTIAVDPGERGIVGMNWERYKTNPPLVPCTPAAKTLEITLPPTVENPHPERKPGKRVAWFGGTDAGVCGKVTMLPVGDMP
jgi:hypothetical protein